MGDVIPMNRNEIPEPPEHLGNRAAKFFSAVADEFELEPHHIALLLAAAEALDRAEQAREQIRQDGGPTVKDRFEQMREHPACLTERAAVDSYLKCLRELALDISEPGEPGRPPGR